MAKTIFIIISGVVALVFFLSFIFFAASGPAPPISCTAGTFECHPTRVSGERMEVMFKQTVTATINDVEIVFGDCKVIPPPGWKETEDGFGRKDSLIYLEKFGPFALQGCGDTLDFEISYTNVQKKKVHGQLQVLG